MDSYVTLRYWNLTAHATESHQGVLTRNDFTFIQIIQVLSYRKERRFS